MRSFNKTRRTLGAGAAAMTLAAGGLASKAQATVFLVGAAEYVTTATDAGGNNTFTYYRHTTNSTDLSHGNLPLTETSPTSSTQSSAVSFALAVGDNTFTTPSIANILFTDRNPAIEFFFNSTGTSYNPTNTTGPGIPGDLAVWGLAGTVGVHNIAAGKSVLDYLGQAASANDHWLATYSGATSFVLNGFERVTVTAFTAGDNTTTAAAKGGVGVFANDTFTLTLSVPEPASLGLFSVAGLMLARRRRV